MFSLLFMICTVETATLSLRVPVYILYPQGTVVVFLVFLNFIHRNPLRFAKLHQAMPYSVFQQYIQMTLPLWFVQPSLPPFGEAESKVSAEFLPRLIKYRATDGGGGGGGFALPHAVQSLAKEKNPKLFPVFFFYFFFVFRPSPPPFGRKK